ncbi:17793_t:CDS:1, partial [Entrophospora sp. SA101]
MYDLLIESLFGSFSSSSCKEEAAQKKKEEQQNYLMMGKNAYDSFTYAGVNCRHSAVEATNLSVIFSVA